MLDDARPPRPGPWPLRVMTPIGEAFIERRPITIGDVEIEVAESIVIAAFAWESGRLVTVERLPGRRKWK